ncbi:MAG: hypothetical protein WA424_05550 [Candidatus Sulfotelmatobacter sp.]
MAEGGKKIVPPEVEQVLMRFVNAVMLADDSVPGTTPTTETSYQGEGPPIATLDVTVTCAGSTIALAAQNKQKKQASPIASVLLTGKVPHIEKAIRMVPHGKQPGLQSTKLRGMVTINPKTDDFFRHVIEQRKRHQSNKSLAHFLKILANAGSYGLFVELTPEKPKKPANIKVFSGQESFPQMSNVLENQGRWYFPPIAALITAAGRLLLAILERCVTDAGGSYLFCDTDSLCIVASEHTRCRMINKPSKPFRGKECASLRINSRH